MNETFLEIKCEDCSEPLLLGEGEKVNYRIIDLSNPTNKIIKSFDNLPNQFSIKFLCSACNKKEDPDQLRIIRVVNSGGVYNPHCKVCGKNDGLLAELDLDGNFTHICENCRDEEDYN